jgi:hypothetical protein
MNYFPPANLFPPFINPFQHTAHHCRKFPCHQNSIAMKNFTLSLFFVFAFALISKAEIIDSLLERQLDSVHYVLLKPRITAYLAKAEDLSAKINAASDKKEIRLYSKQLRDLTDSIYDIADRIYGYKKIPANPSGIVILPNGTLGYATLFTPDVEIGIRPTVHDALYDISAAAGTMHWFPGCKKSQAKEIEKLIGELKTF